MAINSYARSYVTSIEKRLKNLEALFAKLLPDVKIDDALSSFAVSPQEDVQAEVRSQGSHASASVPLEEGGDGAISEAMPDEANGFDWQEEATSFGELTDGMAALSIEPTGAGYLGITCSYHPFCNV